jgi:tetratricopeptide (TPR) repeat protein
LSFQAAGADVNVESAPQKTVLTRITEEAQSEEISNKSFQEIQDLAEKDPNNYHIRIVLGQCLQAHGLPEQALEQYNLAIKLAPNAPEPVAELIKAKLKAGQLKEAEDLITSSRQRFPNSPEILFWVGNYLVSKNQLSAASKLYLEALSKGKTVVGLPTAMAKIELNNAQQQRNPYAANAYYLQAIYLADKDLKVDSKLGDAYHVKGLALMKMGKIAEAIAPLQKAFDSNPKNRDLDLALARCLNWSGNYAGALVPACIYVAEEPENVSGGKDPKQILASILARMSESEIKQSLSSLFTRPGLNRNARFHYALAQFLDGRNLRLLANEQYKAALILSPDSSDAWFHLAYNQENYEQDYQAALESYKNALRYSNGNATIANHLRRLEDRLGQRKDDLAWQLRDKLLRLKKGSADH